MTRTLDFQDWLVLFWSAVLLGVNLGFALGLYWLITYP